MLANGTVGDVAPSSDTPPSSVLAPHLRAGARVVRRIDGDDTPWPGVVARLDDGAPALVVPVAALGRTWPGWALRDPAHVVVPTDIRRSVEGHDAVFPLFVERLMTFLTRRGPLLSDGERVTIAVSVLRGLRELDDAGVTSPGSGSWWLTDDGRPGFALTGDPATSAERASADVLTELGKGEGGLSSLVERTVASVAGGVDERTARRLEDEWFDAASPEALVTVGFGPRSAAAAIAPARADVTADLAASEEPDGAGVLVNLGRYVDGGLAETIGATVERVRRTMTGARSRRSTLLFAGAAAGAVVAIGLLWPVGAEEPATAPVDQGATPASTATTSPVPAAAVGVAANDDLAVVTAALLEARIRCDDDPECLAGVYWSPITSVPPGAVDLDASVRDVEVLDDFGGVAVLRVSGPEAPDQVVVIARRDDSWLLRDVHDVAQQP